jgi:hypothetical protein
MADRLDSTILNSYRAQTGNTLADISAARPLLLVFLRQFG